MACVSAKVDSSEFVARMRRRCAKNQKREEGDDGSKLACVAVVRDTRDTRETLQQARRSPPVPGPVSKRLSVSPSLNHTSPSITPSTSKHLFLSYHIFLYRAGTRQCHPNNPSCASWSIGTLDGFWSDTSLMILRLYNKKMAISIHTSC